MTAAAQSPSAREAEVDRPDAAPRTGVRPMRRDDIPAVEAIFARAFAKGRSTTGLAAYIEAIFFGSPHYGEDHGSIVYDDGKGRITGAILAIPMPFSVHGRRLTARLLCAFMSDGTRAGALGAARLARSVRAGQVDMCFSDNATPVSADHWIASGGIVLPVESLEWRRAFQPLGAAARGAGRNAPQALLRAACAPLRLADRLLLSWKPSIRPVPAPGCAAARAPLSAFLDCAGPMTERFAVRPIWSREDFDWLTRVAAMNDRLGTLQCRTVEKAGETVGAFLFFGVPGATATVMNLVCREGCEHDVVAQMFSCLAGEGYVAATGMAQPFMMNAIMRQRRLTFLHRGYFCLNSRHDDLVEAARMGDIYVGGLASESWSRLVTDF